MYVTNVEAIDKNKLYECNGIVGNYLIYEKHLPLFARDKSVGKYFFVKTEALLKAVEEFSFYYSIVKNIW